MTEFDKLPEWFPKFHHCELCDENGFIVKEGSSTKCECKISHDKKVSTIKGFLDSGVLHENSSKSVVDFLLSISFDSYKGQDEVGNIKKLRQFCKNFKEKYTGLHLFFTGRPGTQKSTVAKVMIKELSAKGISCYYLLANDLIQMIIDSARSEEIKFNLHEILHVDFLVIEELSEDKIISYSSGWQRKNLFPWIKYRIETLSKSTLFISNEKIDNIGAYFGEAIQDLILREIPDHTMIFNDNYVVNRGKIDLSTIWDD